MLRNSLRFLSGALVAVVMAAPALAGTLDVYVAYADGLRGTPNFPSPFCSGATYLNGLCPDNAADTGMVWVRNNTASTISLTGFSVDIGGYHGQIWDGLIGSGQVLASGQSAMFWETANYNFDTSDVWAGSCGSGNGVIPVVNVTIGSTTYNFNDTGQILNTGGYDFACTGDNEAFGWRLIGTTGIDVRTNQLGVPEPLTLCLFGAGLVSAVAMRRRKTKTA